MGFVKERGRLSMGAGRSDDAMAKALDHLLDVHCDQRLVLDDHNVRRDLPRYLSAGLRHQLTEFLEVYIKDFCSLFVIETLDGNEHESLSRARGQRGKICRRTTLPPIERLFVGHANRHGCEQLREK